MPNSHANAGLIKNQRPFFDFMNSPTLLPKPKHNMKTIYYCLLLLLITASTNCSFPEQKPFVPKIVYQSSTLTLTQIAAHAFQHVSYKQTNDFGNVPCNGLVVSNGAAVIVFDTPTKDSSALELINWVKDSLHGQIKAVVPTHFHDDCLGGLKAFDSLGIASYANVKTIELAKASGLFAPKNGFADSLVLPLGKEQVLVKFFGEGHTKDNVVGYFASEGVLFGGCLVKELDASKGYLGDANLQDWSATVAKVKKAFPNAKTVVPGHGKVGDQKLLDYTISLFKVQ
jgi:metallo-beta-lactamase class B